jgi:hypothetical protein
LIEALLLLADLLFFAILLRADQRFSRLPTTDSQGIFTYRETLAKPVTVSKSKPTPKG